ncbi:hypothetical protein [Virgibacillus salexigens]|uniref:hypothetical protein n=1 Tax=Virgibacillus TaxID=84406 RepID=UPI00136ABA7D|nr:hypothetical protein [Virgibacillus massiliensis]MYL43185.1 hypothetical protein [Virgibacillus massiliensis]
MKMMTIEELVPEDHLLGRLTTTAISSLSLKTPRTSITDGCLPEHDEGFPSPTQGELGEGES